ncbi:MAG TPA: hypothetical protein VFU58_02970 [Candidatus Nitrosotalea sp.]|nr:hypothetical protein [Candidatus Nitrosotalea sp.]
MTRTFFIATIFLTVIFLIVHVLPVFASVPTQCGYHLVFDKYIFVTEKEIPIKVIDLCNQYHGKKLVVTVVDANNPERKLLEQKLVFDNSVQVTFTPVSDVYSYLVTASDENGNSDKATFFTKENASNIKFDDVLIPNHIKAGSTLDIKLKIKNGLGQSIGNISVLAIILTPDCVKTINPNDIDGSLVYASPYYVGSLQIPDYVPSGKYRLSIFANDLPGYPYMTTTIPLQIENTGPQPVTHLFYDIREHNGGFNSPLGFAPGDNVVITGKTQTDTCISLSGVNVTAQLTGFPTIMIRGSSVSDEAGNFSISLQTYPQMDPNRVSEIQLFSKYENKTYSWQDPHEFSMSDIKRYTFYVDGKNSTAEIQADQGTTLASLTLDKESKKLVMIGANSPSNQGQFTLIIPSELLSGDLFVETGDNAIVMVNGTNNWSDTYGPDLAPDDSRHAYGLSVSKYDGYAKVFYSTLTPGQKKIEIIGTNVIPEFPFAIPVLLVSITSLIMYYGIKFRK